MLAIAEKKGLPFYDASKVIEAAAGHWLEVFHHLASAELGQAIRNPKKHVTCPIHGTNNKGGKGDGFRFFKDVVQTGGGICNSCGAYPNGIILLMEIKGWDFPTTLSNVAEFLRIEPESANFRNSTTRQSKVDFSKGIEYVNKSGGVGKTPISFVKKRRDGLNEICFNGGSGSVFLVDDYGVKPKNKSNGAVTVRNSGNEAKADLPKETKSQEGANTVVPLTQTPSKEIQEVIAIQEQISNDAAIASAEAEKRVSQTWRESISLDNGVPLPIFKYWKKRKVLLRPEIITKGDNIRYHPELPYYDEDEDGNVIIVGKFPAIIAAIRDSKGEIITLHRTYLTTAGNKANVECPRKMMSVPDDKTVTGTAAIKLGGLPKDGVLGVAEGLETAQSVMSVYGIPTWSLVNTTLLEKLDIPWLKSLGVKTLLIWADKDRSNGGQKAAVALKEAAEAHGVKVYILLPNRPIRGKSIDWNDILIKEGRMGFPEYNQIMKLIA